MDWYPRPADLTARWQICGICSAKSWRTRFSPTARRHAFAVKKPPLAARKIARIPVAFSSPQELHIELMFGAARFGEPALRASRSFVSISRRAEVIRRSVSAHRTSASISTGFSTQQDVSPRHAA